MALTEANALAGISAQAKTFGIISPAEARRLQGGDMTTDINAAAQRADAGSVFHHHRRLIALRREHPVLVHGEYRDLDPEHQHVYAYTRTLGDVTALVLLHLGDETHEYALPDGLTIGSTLVVNADDPLVLRMAGYTEAKSICYVTMNPQHVLVREHIRAGGRACALEAGVNGQMITLYDRGSHIPLVWTHLIPATLEGRAMHNVQNAMFAAAMAYSLGIKLDAIRHGLRTFDSTFFQAPGRMNVFNEHPFKVLFDYGHNAHAVGVMADLAQRLDVVAGLTVCAILVPEGMAYAELAGVPPEYAFYAAPAALLAYAALAWLHPQRQFWHDAACGTRLITWQPPKRRKT